MERYIEPNEKLMLVECIEEDWGIKVGELCWAVTEYNTTYNRVFYKVIDNVRHIFLNCPNREAMLEMFKIIDECDITFMEKQAWAYGDMRQKHPEYFPATKEQRDLLFQKMKEAGLEWDAENKELKKIKYPRRICFPTL